MSARTKDKPVKAVKRSKHDRVEIAVTAFLNKGRTKAGRIKVMKMVHSFIDDQLHDVVKDGKTHADIHDIGSVCLICEGEVMEICV